MSGQEPQVWVAGFPDFWERAFSLNPEAYRAFIDLSALQNIIYRKPVRKPVLRVMRFITKVVGNSAGSVVLLTLNGYGHDAMRVARSMFEGAVTVGYLARHPEEYADYRDFMWVRQRRLYDYMARNDPQQLKRLKPDQVRRMIRKYRAVVGRFTDKNGRLRVSWSKKSISQRAVEAGLGELYATFYSTASSMHHLDVGGLGAQFEPGLLDADVAPSESFVKTALIMAHNAILNCLVNYNRAARLGMTKQLKAAKKDFMRAWKK